MNLDDVLRKLRACEAALHERGVSHAAVFGSVARGDCGPDSDVDILVEIAPEAEVDLFQYVGIVHYLEDLFPARIDVANRGKLKSFVRRQAERDAVYAF